MTKTLTQRRLNMASTEETRAVIRVLEAFHKVDPDITLPSMLAFMYVNERDAQSGNQNYVERRLNMTNATTSRAIAHWAEFKRPRVEGLNMVVSIPDPEDRRFKLITLTRKGLDFIEKIRSAFNGSE